MYHLYLFIIQSFPYYLFYFIVCQHALLKHKYKTNSSKKKKKKSLLQHQSSKASILWCSAFFTVQLTHPYMTNGKTIALTGQTFVGKVMSLPFNMLSRLIITFLPRSNQPSFNFMAAITICSDFGACKNKVWHCFHCFPIYFPWSDGPDAMILVFWMLSFFFFNFILFLNFT